MDGGTQTGAKKGLGQVKSASWCSRLEQITQNIGQGCSKQMTGDIHLTSM
jgi:hypothetical protein